MPHLGPRLPPLIHKLLHLLLHLLYMEGGEGGGRDGAEKTIGEEDPKIWVGGGLEDRTVARNTSRYSAMSHNLIRLLVGLVPCHLFDFLRQKLEEDEGLAHPPTPPQTHIPTHTQVSLAARIDWHIRRLHCNSRMLSTPAKGTHWCLYLFFRVLVLNLGCEQWCEKWGWGVFRGIFANWTAIQQCFLPLKKVRHSQKPAR